MAGAAALLAVIGVLAGAGALAAQADPGGQVSDLTIRLEVEPTDLEPGATEAIPDRRLRTLPGVPLRIRGLTAPTLAGKAITIVITPPQVPEPPDPRHAPGKTDPTKTTELLGEGRVTPVPPTSLSALVGVEGRFEAQYVPVTTGTHSVDAADASRRYRGVTSFEVLSPREVGEQIKEQAEELARELRRLLEAIRAALAALPPSPGKEAAQARLGELERESYKTLPGTGLEWPNAIDHLPDLRATYPQVRESLRPLEQKLSQWHAEAGPHHREVKQKIAELSSGNELCDNLAAVIHATKMFAYVLPFLLSPRDFIVDWAKEHSVPALRAKVPAAHITPTIDHALDLGWKSLVTFAPKFPGVSTANQAIDRAIDGNWWGEHHQAHLHKETVTKFAFETAEFITELALHHYCEEFSGNFEAAMTAEFFDQGYLWWSYEMKLKGQLTLRYAKNRAKIGPEPPAGGQVIAVTGEFSGYPTYYKSWDNAVPVLFPKLAAGTILLKKVWEPLGGEWIQSSFLGPLSVGHAGDYTKFYTVPGFFRVPVRGELRGKNVTLHLLDTNLGGPLTFTEKKFLVMLSPLSMLTTTTYGLPYKDGPFIIRRATHEAPLSLSVRYEGKTMVIEESYNRERNSGDAIGKYRLHLKTCNPACSSHGGEPVKM
jgi:hypothetical protein